MQTNLQKIKPVIRVKLCGKCDTCKFHINGSCTVAKIAETLCKHGQTGK